MDNEYDKSKRKFGPFKFTGIVRKRAIHVYNISLDLLKKGRKFEVIELSKNKCSFFIGNKGKLVRFYEHDRSIRFHVPHKLIQDFNKRVAVDIYTDDEELASLFKHVMGLVRLKTNNFWFKSDSSRKFPQSTQITISSRALTDYFFKKGIKKMKSSE